MHSVTLSQVGVSAPIFIDPDATNPLTIAVDMTEDSNLQYSVDFTIDRPGADGAFTSSASWFSIDADGSDVNTGGGKAPFVATLKRSARALRLKVVDHQSGSVTLKVYQDISSGTLFGQLVSVRVAPGCTVGAVDHSTGLPRHYTPGEVLGVSEAEVQLLVTRGFVTSI